MKKKKRRKCLDIEESFRGKHAIFVLMYWNGMPLHVHYAEILYYFSVTNLIVVHS